MPRRVKIDDPGVMERILEDIKTTPLEYWLDLLDRYDSERPGDVILPGVPPKQDIVPQMLAVHHSSKKGTRAKKLSRKRREAA